tara:strand:- start:1037 stop:1489 length:453 start_codon:yes stop_codon:yes gene_type:complete
MHNFDEFPELTNNQMAEEYFNSPHKQIVEDFRGKVEKVHDGDTVTLSTDFRDFKFPMRLIKIDAPELNAEGGSRSRDYLKELIEGKEVDILIDPKKRTEKWGRLLGDIVAGGNTISEDMVRSGFALPFNRRREAEFPDINKEMDINKWFS